MSKKNKRKKPVQVSNKFEKTLKNEILFGYKPNLAVPLCQDTVNLLQYKIDNFYKMINLSNSVVNNIMGGNNYNYVTNFGVDSNYSIKNIPVLANPKTSTQTPFAFPDDLRNKFIKSNKLKLFLGVGTKYFKKHGDKKSSTSVEYKMTKTYYMAEVDGQCILFREIVDRPLNVDKFPKHLYYLKNVGSYSLEMYVNGKSIGNNLLFRLDFNSPSAHQNFFECDENYDNNPSKKLRILPNGKNVFGSHIHFTNLATSILLPQKCRSSVATSLNTSNLSFDDIIKIIRQEFNFISNVQVFDKTLDGYDKNTNIPSQFMAKLNSLNCDTPSDEFFITTLINAIEKHKINSKITTKIDDEVKNEITPITASPTINHSSKHVSVKKSSFEQGNKRLTKSDIKNILDDEYYN